MSGEGRPDAVAILPVYPLAELPRFLGHRLGVSDWLTMESGRLEAFTQAAGSLGGEAANLYLSLSLIPWMSAHAFVISGVRMSVNYGLNRVRFMTPAVPGVRLRGHFKLVNCEPLDGGWQMTTEVSIECEGQATPILVAETLSRRYS